MSRCRPCRPWRRGPLRELVGPSASVSVLPNGIDVARWRTHHPDHQSSVQHTPPSTLSSVQHTPLRLVTAMRLATRKRPRALVELVVRAERLAGRGSFSLTILGEGPDRRRVESYLAGEGIDWVSLPGRVPRDELRDRYAAADVYVSPSALESFGIAALEARTAGLPVIGRSGSGIGEFVTHGEGGLIVPDDAAMAGALAGLAADRERVAAMRRWNLDHSPEQDWPPRRRARGHRVRAGDRAVRSGLAADEDERPRRHSRRRAGAGRDPGRGRPTRPWPAPDQHSWPSMAGASNPLGLQT